MLRLPDGLKLFIIFISVPVCGAEGEVDFVKEVKPLLEGACVRCHGPDEQKSGFRLDRKEDGFQGGEKFGEGVIQVGKAKDSSYTCRRRSFATPLYPRVIRGGFWYDDPDSLCSASRDKSSSDLKDQDADLPKILWYNTDAHWLGFRIVRPLKIPPVGEMERIWYSGRIIEQ